jgi:serine/threonine protein kinase
LATPFERLEGKYEILEKIREGGMGSVYKVRHRLLDEVRVVKVMRPHLAKDEVLRARFLREAKVAIRLHHPNLAQIYDFTVDDHGYAYLVMEFIDGLNLQDVIKILRRPSIGLALEVADQSLDALGYLHKKRIIHRDVSPDNILVCRDEDRDLQIKLIDLGIAKVREGDESLTSAGTFLGKVRYSSPEHFKTHEGTEVTSASDLYSFGVVLYEFLTGIYPIRGSSMASLITGHLMHPPRDFKTSDPDGAIPEELRKIVLKTLEKDPGDRYETAKPLRAALDPIREHYPVDDAELTTIFEVPSLTTRKIPVVKPGSTQSRINESFGLSTTPPPGAESDPDADLETSGTIESGSSPDGGKIAQNAALQAQLSALLRGSGKLVEGRHYEEARLQLATALELDPDNAEAKKLLKKAEAADQKLQKRRQDAAAKIRQLIDAESFVEAESEIEKAVSHDGASGIFDELRTALDDAKVAVAERDAKVRDIADTARALIAEEEFDEAVDSLIKGLSLAPGDKDLTPLLTEAERGQAAQHEARRRAQEIEETVATITGHLDARDASQADRAISLARKLYGEEDVFSVLSSRLDELREELLLEKVRELSDSAREQMEEGDFEAAISSLQNAAELVPDQQETADLLAGAREGLRIQEEARRRQEAIDEAEIKVDRLILAGRLESAIHLIDTTVEEIGDFEEAADFRSRIAEEKKTCDERIARVRSALERALDLAASDKYADAEQAVDQARSEIAECPELADEVADTENEVRRRIEAFRRRLSIANVTKSVEAQIEKGEIEEAQRELAVARRLYGASGEFDALDEKIEARGRELQQAKIDELLKQARKKNRTFEEIMADLEAAIAIDPHNEDVLRLMVETRIAQKREREQQLADENQTQLAVVDQFIADGEIERALDALNAATREVGDFRDARILRLRLENSIKNERQ